MKATIITLAIAGIMTIGNINNATAKQKTYTNTSIENNIKTTTVYTGDNDKYLVRTKKCVIKYNELGAPVEKTIYVWNDGQWVYACKYDYSYSSDKQLEKLSYTQPNLDPQIRGDKSIEIMYYAKNEMYSMK